MDILAYILFISVVTPLLLSLLLLDGKSRLISGYLIIGMFVSLFVSELNTLILNSVDKDMVYVSTTITPVTEEVLKALPVLFYAFVFSDSIEKLTPISFSLGIGFALFENMVVLVQSISNVTISWALIRGLSTALLHAVCTVMIGYGMSFVRKRKKFFYCGTFALLSTAILYHAIFNMLVQSEYDYIGFILPGLTYIPILVSIYDRKKKAINKSTAIKKADTGSPK